MKRRPKNIYELLAIYHWNALNWLFKLLEFELAIWLLPNRWPCGWTFGMLFEYCVFWVGLMTPPNKLLLRLLLLLLLICKEDGVGDVLTGLCNFNWFMESDGPLDFDLPDIKLSKSMFIAPELDHVWPTTIAVAFCWLHSDVIVDCGWSKLLVGKSMLAKIKRNRYLH